MMSATFSDKLGHFSVANVEMIVPSDDINGFIVYFADSKEVYKDTKLVQVRFEG